VCFIPSECFKATTSGFSHQQLVSEPRSSENRSVLGVTTSKTGAERVGIGIHYLNLGKYVRKSTGTDSSMK